MAKEKETEIEARGVDRLGAGVPDHDIEISSYVDWRAIFAGAVIAVAVGFVLLTFGGSIGLSLAAPATEGGLSLTTVGMGAALWFALVQIYSVGMGAYFAGRLRPRLAHPVRNEVAFRDGANGLVVWASAIILTILVSMHSAFSAASAVTNAGAAALRGTAVAVAPIVDDTVDRLLRPRATPSSTDSENPRQGQGLTQPRQDPELIAGARKEMKRILANTLADGSVSKEDVDYIAQLVASRTDLTRRQAEDRIEAVLSKATKTAKATVEDVRQSSALGGFFVALVVLLSGIAAWWSGTLGGHHRDEVETERTT